MSPPRRPSRNWCYTWNNPHNLFGVEDPGEDTEALVALDLQIQEVLAEFEEKVRFHSWQLERGESGTLHVQGYIVLKSPNRYTWVINQGPWEYIHLEIRGGDHSEAEDYTTREFNEDGTRKRCEGVEAHVIGERPRGAGHRSDLDEVRKNLMSALNQLGELSLSI